MRWRFGPSQRTGGAMCAGWLWSIVGPGPEVVVLGRTARAAREPQAADARMAARESWRLIGPFGTWRRDRAASCFFASLAERSHASDIREAWLGAGRDSSRPDAAGHGGGGLSLHVQS